MNIKHHDTIKTKSLSLNTDHSNTKHSNSTAPFVALDKYLKGKTKSDKNPIIY